MKKTFSYVSSDKGDIEQQKIRKTFSERSVNVEMERGDIGFKKIKKLLEEPIYVKKQQYL